MLVLLPDPRFENTELITLLGALEALYVVSGASVPKSCSCRNFGPRL